MLAFGRVEVGEDFALQLLQLRLRLGMIVTMFPEPGEQARAIGVYSFVASAGGSIGLLAGGAITEAINWHWIFIVNLPIAATVLRTPPAAGEVVAVDSAEAEPAFSSEAA